MPPPLLLRPSRPSYVIPTTTLYPGPLSLSLLTERFHRRRFFSGLVAVCRLSLYRILSSTGAPYEARARARALLSALPGNVLTTSVLLFLRRSARLLSRARGLFCHYPLCFLHILCSTILFSLPSLLPASQFFHRRFPFPASPEPHLNGARPVSPAIPNLV